PEHAGKGEARKLLYHEASVGKQLTHANVIRIVTVNKDPKNPYFVMEYFPGGSLKQRMMTKQHDFVRDNALSFVKQAATGLAYMNASGWVHRDIKPDNMLVSSAGELKLIDFALAQKIEKKPGFLAAMVRRKGKVAGTRSYMSPEQIRGEYLDGRADIYSFGATCFEIVTGRPPFRGASAQDLLAKHIVEKPVTPKVHNP